MKPEMLARIILESVMRGLLKALPARVDEAVEKRVAPFTNQVGVTAERVTLMETRVRDLYQEFDARIAHACEEFRTVCQSEIATTVGGLRIESDADGFLYLSAGANVRAALGFRPFQYHGTYQHDGRYNVNDAVTCRGSLWIARGPVAGIAPGTDQGAEHWTLAVKCGKDGRNGARGDNG